MKLHHNTAAQPCLLTLITNDLQVATDWEQIGIHVIIQSKPDTVQVQQCCQDGSYIILWRHNLLSTPIHHRHEFINGTGQQGKILNRYAQQWTNDTMRERLRLWGLPVIDHATWDVKQAVYDQQQYVRTVCFWVNNYHIVAVGQCMGFPQNIPTYIPVHNWSKLPYRRLARLALRATYALGWDIAAVTLRCHSALAENRPITGFASMLDEPQTGDGIVHIEPVPKRLPIWVQEKYKSAWSMAVNQVNRKTVKLGLDAELILYDAQRNKLIFASKYVAKGGEVGCDAVWLRGRITYPLLELRPSAASHPFQLVKNLQHTMQVAEQTIRQQRMTLKQNPRLHWLAGSYPQRKFPLGGHIHVSGISLCSELIHALDTYVAIPLSLLEAPQAALRRRPRYGTFGDVREHEHGGEGGFEYRTPSSFIVSPTLTLEILTLFWIVVTNYALLLHRDSMNEQVVRAYLGYAKTVDIFNMRRLALQLLADILRLLHKEHQDQPDRMQVRIIQSLYARIQSNWRWDEQVDICTKWLSTARE